MKKTIVLLLWMTALATPLWAKDVWEAKPFEQWSEKDARSVMDNSPWCAEFVYATGGNLGVNVDRTSTIGQLQTGGVSRTDDNTPDVRGEVSSEREFRVFIKMRLYSSHPVRQAMVVLLAKGDAKRLQKLTPGATSNFDDEIVISWEVDSQPKGVLAARDVDMALRSITMAELQTNTCISTDKGKKVCIKDFIKPASDGTGAKFIFPRVLPDGTPLITPDTKTLRLQTGAFKMKNQVVPIDATFKIDKCLFNRQLDY